MPSDRTRFSFDEAQQYRSVVIQQGKALLDSDLNEAQQIQCEELRDNALDFVGPVGTPDNGYEVTIPAGTTNADFQVGAGTMYVGGVRVSLPAAVRYSTQPDWLAPDPSLGTFPRSELVYLELIEHEVSALEDRALLEPALGGPDTAQRMRIMQRIRRTNTNANNCTDALAAQLTAWAATGRTFDAATQRLVPRSTLRVSIAGPSAPTDACDPVAHGGFLGAENQLIRVCISDTSKFVWAYDDGSALYRVDRLTGGDTQLVLVNTPVDEAHQPRTTQVVELVRAAGRLPNGDFFTEPFGAIATMASDYNPDTRTITLTSAVTNDFKPDPNRPLFVRIWEENLTFTAGTPATLRNTGLQVTLQVAAGSAFVRGDFWTFAARPGTPGEVYPKRYITAPQPPEGPRTWAVGLAVLNWTAANAGSRVADCREQFDNLVELTKRRTTEARSCCVMVGPEDVRNGSLQPIIDRAKDATNLKFCLLPGGYALTAPLVITGDHNALTIEACAKGVTITGDGAALAAGLVQLENATDVTFSGIRFQVPIVVRQGRTDRAGIGIGVRMIHTTVIKFENCDFTFTAPDLPAALGICILANGVINGLVVRDCLFGGVQGENIATVGIAGVPGFFAQPAPRRPGGEVDFDRFDFGRFTSIDPSIIQGLKERIKPRPVPVTDEPFVFDPTAPPDKGRPDIGGPNITPTKPDTGTTTPGRPDTGTTTGPIVDRPDIATGGGVTTGGGTIFQPGGRPTTGGGGIFTRPGGGTISGDTIFQPQPGPRAEVSGAGAFALSSAVAGNIFVGAVDRPGFVLDPAVFDDFLVPGRADDPVSVGAMLPARGTAIEIVENRFALMHAAVLLCGDFTSVRIAENHVEASANGVIVVATRWISNIAFLSPARVLQIFRSLAVTNAPTDEKGQWDAVQASSQVIATMVWPRNSIVASALMSIPLPDSLERDRTLIPLAGVADDSDWPRSVGQLAAQLFPLSTSALNLPGSFGRQGLTTDILRRLTTAWAVVDPLSLLIDRNVAALGFAPLEKLRRGTVLALDCTSNDIDVRASGSGEGSAVFVLDAPGAARSSALLNDSRLSNDSATLPTAVVAFVSRCDVTGALVLNETTFGGRTQDPITFFWSLVLFPAPSPDAAGALGVPLVAITGNVFKGWPVLPPRGINHEMVPDPYNRWLFLNTLSY